MAINQSIMELSPLIERLGISLTHICGKRDFDRVSSHYQQFSLPGVRVYPFVDDIAGLYSHAHLIVCRAGAMTAAEVCVSGRPAIFIPLTIAGAHQHDNINFLLKKDAALMIEQSDTLADALGEKISYLVNHPERLQALAENARECGKERSAAAEFLALRVLEIAGQRNSV